MSASISVFVICRNETYLIRSLNSIMRQSLKPIEIIVISDNAVKTEIAANMENVTVMDGVDETIYQKLNRALQTAKGDFVLLSSNTANVTDNLLEDLYANTLKDSQTDQMRLASATLYVPDHDTYRVCDGTLSIYGKLYELKQIREKHIMFPEDSSLGEYLFLDAYLKLTQGITVCANAGVYEVSTEAFDLLGNKYVLESAQDVEWKTLQMQNAQGGILPVVAQCKSVVAKASDGAIQMVVMQNLWPEPPKELVERLVEEQVAIRVEEERSHLEPIIQTQTLVQEKVRELTGFEFASQMPERAARGEIGLKSIMKCLGAWIKGKFGRRS